MNDKVIYFDGMCNLCNGFVKFIIRHEVRPDLKFASLQSASGAVIMNKTGLATADVSTIIFTEDTELKVKSKAVFAIAGYLRAPFSWLRVFALLPTSVTDYVYDFVAKNRYKWFGKEDSCMVPTAALRPRFVDQ